MCLTQCLQPSGYVADSTDCDDTDAGINPTTTWYEDGDSDGYGNAAVSLTQCLQPSGYVLDNTDCDDDDTAVNPGVTEIIGNGIDDDCDTATVDIVIDIPDGVFGEQYEGLVPEDVTIEAYDYDRFAIITGSVKDSSLSP
ncbi:MAG: hypothetical protein GY775_00420, partial [Candidatus Scalindua sp.]|nr:hypothetical protein [Candidatus Scalindua sp.]